MEMVSAGRGPSELPSSRARGELVHAVATARAVSLHPVFRMRVRQETSRPRSRSALLLSALIALCGATSAVRADFWYEHYKRGEDAIKAADWKTAVSEFTQSIEQKPDPANSIRTYGMNFISYHPYLKLGIAYYNLGEFDRALKAFDTEESFGAVAKSPGDLNNLTALRKLANEESQKARLLTEKQRIAAIVAKSLQDAHAAEGRGSTDEALQAVGTGLAVDPNNADLSALMRRLQAKAAEEERSRGEQETVTKRLKEGKDLLEAGKYEAASAAFNQVLALRPGDAEAQSLLAESRSKLKDLLEKEQSASARRTLVNDSLSKAEALMTEIRGSMAGPEIVPRINAVLEGLQSVLALDPTHQRAAQLQKEFMQARAQTESATSQSGEIARLLQIGVSSVEGGRFDDSLAALTRVIALDPTNATATKYLGLAYRGMSDSLLAPGAPILSPKRPPVVVLANQANFQRTTGSEAGASLPEERVTSEKFVLSGVVLDDQPDLNLTIVTADSPASTSSKESVVNPTVQTARMGDLYQYSFTQPMVLHPGILSLRVVAKDPDGLSDEKIHLVSYARPPWRSPWLYSAAGLVAAGGLGTLAGMRVRRRNNLLKRRFNPFVAGAPVLSDDLFLGREALITRVLQTIHNNSVLLYGERRIGKTSLQHHIRRRLEQLQDPEYEFHPVFIDLQGTPQERFFGTLAHDIVSELRSKLDGKVEGPSGPEDPSYTYDRFVRDVHSVLKHLRQLSTKKVKLVLLIDEVDELNDYDPKVNQKLRSLFMKSFAEDMVAVVSGVGIKKHWASEGSPWYNFFEEIEVKPFRREDAAELIEKPIRGVFGLEDGVIDRILDKTNCRPYLIQKACVALVNRLHEEGRRRITIADVDAIERPEEG